ncbi:MAG: hypothetical protein JXA73_26470 [Acidobacteria bacterium]|nr:hypothetical protein [Acidobacteriota bacterium]
MSPFLPASFVAINHLQKPEIMWVAAEAAIHMKAVAYVDCIIAVTAIKPVVKPLKGT